MTHLTTAHNCLIKKKTNNMFKNKVTVIGSAHLDILADYNARTKNNIDKIGNLKIALGGSAYNIAVNLAMNKNHVGIITVLKKNSLSSKLIMDSLSQKKIDTGCVINEEFIPESGFVAQRLLGKLETAVSSTTIERVRIDKSLLVSSVTASFCVVIDCNLSPLQIIDITEICNNLKKPVFVSSVSESKVERAVAVKHKSIYAYKLFSLNSLEARRNFEWMKITEKDDVVNLCIFYHAEIVVITNGSRGYSVFQNDGNRMNFEAPVVPVVSELGAGDALLAAIVSYYCKNEKFDWDECKHTIDEFVIPTLGVEEGTVGAAQTSEFNGFITNSNSFDGSLFGKPEKIKDEFDVFVLMPFKEPFFEMFTIIKGEASQFNLSCGTAGDIFGSNTIIKDIWSGIFYSNLVIADCTGRNPNVFYEIGIAHTLGKPTLLLTQNMDDVPFDLRHLRVRKYEHSYAGIEKLKIELRSDITRLLVL